MDEKKLTKAEIDKKEDVIKAIAKEKGGKDKLKPVDYAIATDTAKRVAESIKKALTESPQDKEDVKEGMMDGDTADALRYARQYLKSKSETDKKNAMIAAERSPDSELLDYIKSMIDDVDKL